MSPEKILELLALSQQGWGFRRIAAHLDENPSRVNHWRRRLDLPTRGVGGAPPGNTNAVGPHKFLYRRIVG